MVDNVWVPKSLPSEKVGEVLIDSNELKNVYETSDFKQGFNRGVYTERERIIKLLETKVLKNVSPDIHSLELLHNQLVNNLIALIKGENK